LHYMSGLISISVGGSSPLIPTKESHYVWLFLLLSHYMSGLISISVGGSSPLIPTRTDID